MFDILWIQSDFKRQQKIKQTYFDIFKGLKLKSENYHRDWNFERKAFNNSTNQNNIQDKQLINSFILQEMVHQIFGLKFCYLG